MSVNTFDKNNGDLTPLSKLYQIESGNEVSKLFEEIASLKTQVEYNTDKINELENSSNNIDIPVGTAYGWTEGAAVTAVVGTASKEVE